MPEGRPRSAWVSNASNPWPAFGTIPPAGSYRVSTTWRDVIDAAMSVGRDVTPWMAAVPSLAHSEIIARRSPLFAYLGRTWVGTASGGTGFVVEPNVVYTDGTELTARSAFGYRIGMTMAEWAVRGLLGLGPTTHAEAQVPAIAGSGWSTTTGLPDLVGHHPWTGQLWLVEAKGATRLHKAALRKGAEQLCRPGLVSGPHVKVLCGTSLTDRLFVTLDVEEVPGTSPRLSTSDDDQLLALTQSRMLSYFALRSLPTEALRVLPVGFGVAERGSRPGGVGAVTLLEDDSSTAAERESAREQSRYQNRPGHARFDMLTGRVPGTDLVIGMSRRLFGACAALAQVEADVAFQVDAELPRRRLFSQDGEAERIEQIRFERRALQHRLVRERRTAAADTTRRGFEQGALRSWDQLINRDVAFTVDPYPGFLEAATEDTYLAVDAATVAGG